MAASDASVDSDETSPVDASGREPRRRVRWIAAAVCFAVAVGALAAAVARSGDDRTDTTGGTASTSTLAGGSTTTAPGATGSTAGGPTGTSLPQVGSSGWPISVEVRPAQFGPYTEAATAPDASTAPGLYLWSDFAGWHLWLLGDAGTEVRGSVSVDASPGSVVADTIGGAEVATTADGFTFTLTAGDTRAAGLVFNPGFYTRRVSFQVDGTPPALFTGYYLAPQTLPYTIEKPPA